MTDVRKNPPFVVRFMRKKLEEKETVFMRLGKLLYVLRSIAHSRDPNLRDPVHVDGDYWIGSFSVIEGGHKTFRRFYDEADGIWTIFKQPEGWELQKREVPASQQVDEARRRKMVMSEPLDMKAELLLSLIDKEFQKERGIPTSINLFGRGLSGVLTKVQRNNDNTVTLYTQIEDRATKEIWTGTMTVDNKDLAHIKLTKQDGVLKLVGSKDTAFEDLREERDGNEPMFLVMLRKLLAGGKTVYATSFDQGNNPIHALVKDAHFNEHFGTVDVDVEIDGDDGGVEHDQYGYTEDEVANLKFKNENDTWFIVDLDGNLR